MATRSSTTCPWRTILQACIIKYMNILHTEACKPQEKIAKFVYTVRQNFPSPTMDLEKDKESTKHLPGSKESTKQSKRAVQDPSSRTKRTANSETSDTDSAYSTESESNYTAHLPRPPCSPKPTRQHLQTHPVPSTRPSKSQQTYKHKMHPGDQTIAHPHSKTHKEQQKNQPSQHLDTSAKDKHF